ncbi:MAG: Smr/MutS family protein [bacterium]
MDQLSAKIFAAQLKDDLPGLDLHGLYPNDAIDKLDVFLFKNSNQDEQVLRIIYGGGTGELGEKVRAYLSNHSLVKQIIKEHGSCLIVV